MVSRSGSQVRFDPVRPKLLDSLAYERVTQDGAGSAGALGPAADFALYAQAVDRGLAAVRRQLAPPRAGPNWQRDWAVGREHRPLPAAIVEAVVHDTEAFPARLRHAIMRVAEMIGGPDRTMTSMARAAVHLPADGDNTGLLFEEPVTPNSMVRRAREDEPKVMAMLDETQRLIEAEAAAEDR